MMGTLGRLKTSVGGVAVAIASLSAAAGGASGARAEPVSVTPATMPRVATIDERYLSYNVEMAEVIGGKFWKPYDTLGKAARQATSAPAAPTSGGAGLQAGQDAAMFQARPPIDLTNPPRRPRPRASRAC